MQEHSRRGSGGFPSSGLLRLGCLIIFLTGAVACGSEGSVSTDSRAAADQAVTETVPAATDAVADQAVTESLAIDDSPTQADAYVELLTSGDCRGAWGWNSSGLNNTLSYESYTSEFCDRMEGTTPIKEYVGGPGDGYFGEQEYTTGFRIDDQVLLLCVYRESSIVGLEWADIPRDIECV